MTWPTSNPVARELDDFWKESQSLWQQWWFEADLDTKMMTGQQDYWNTFYNVNYRNQKILMFNKILRIKNMIEGYQRNNRLGSVVYPADNDPDRGQTAEDLTTVLNWVYRQDNTYERISETFGGMITCGLNLLNIWMDFREDPENGEIRTSRLPFNSFLMDNYWTRSDLSDCDRIWTRRYITTPQLKSLMPDIGDDIPYLGKGYAAKDGKFQFLAQNWYQYQQEMYAYDEYWKRDYRETKKLVDTVTGEMVEWKGNREQLELMRKINPNVKVIKAQVPTIKLQVLVNNHLVFEEQSPWGLDRFPFVPYTCYHFTEVQNYAYRYQGIVRNIRDSQIELNRRRNRLLDILDAQVQSGIMVKEDALVNPEDAFFQGPGKVMYFKNTANLATDVAPFPTPPVAQGWQELIQTLDNEIMQIVGTPEELYGQDAGKQEMSGILYKLKMGAGLTSLANIFDNLNCAQKETSNIVLELMQKNFSIAKVRNILGRAPTQEFNDAWMTKYHCVTEEAELTDTQRQLQFLQAIQLKQMGMPISNKYILEKSTLAGKKEIIDDMLQQEQQMQQLQQAQQMAELQQSQMLGRSLDAKAKSDLASAQEKQAKVYLDIASAKEKASQAVEDRALAALNNAKAAKELGEMDENRLYKLATYIADLQIKEAQIGRDEESHNLTIAQGLSGLMQKSSEENKPAA